MSLAWLSSQKSLLVPLLTLTLLSCSSVGADRLEGEVWVLRNIQSMDDSDYTPNENETYSLSFTDQAVSIVADCNRGRASVKKDGPSSLVLGPIMTTKMMCRPGSMHDRFLSNLEYVRSYVFEKGNLYLATMADGAILEFSREIVKADGPSFDCSKAEGSVQKEICGNEELARLDRRLSDVFNQAVKSVGELEIKTLRAYQRGWVKGRDECWKEVEPEACLKDSYQRRITGLEIASATNIPGSIRFECPGNVILTAYFYEETELPAMALNRHHDQVILFRMEDGSYVGRNVSFVEVDDLAKVEWNTEDEICKRR